MMEYIIPAVISAISGGIFAYATLKRMTNSDKLLELFEEVSAEILTNEELQKRVYAIGALLGKGIVDGTGLKGRTTGKRGLEGLIMEIAGNWIGQRLNQPQQQPQGGFPFGQT